MLGSAVSVIVSPSILTPRRLLRAAEIGARAHLDGVEVLPVEAFEQAAIGQVVDPAAAVRPLDRARHVAVGGVEDVALRLGPRPRHRTVRGREPVIGEPPCPHQLLAHHRFPPRHRSPQPIHPAGRAPSPRFRRTRPACPPLVISTGAPEAQWRNLLAPRHFDRSAKRAQWRNLPAPRGTRGVAPCCAPFVISTGARSAQWRNLPAPRGRGGFDRSAEGAVLPHGSGRNDEGAGAARYDEGVSPPPPARLRSK